LVWVVSLSTMDVSTHCVSPAHFFQVFGVWLGLVSLWDPLAHPVLYPLENTCEALPK
jgi:hypothetical protein